jgi:hypothetical protein
MRAVRVELVTLVDELSEMPQRHLLVETIQARIKVLSDSIANFEYARERLLKLQKSAEGSTGVQLEHALAKNQEATEAMKRDLTWELERLRKEESRA